MVFIRRVSFDCYSPQQIPQAPHFNSTESYLPRTPFSPNHRKKQPERAVLKEYEQGHNQTLQGRPRRQYNKLSDSELLQLDSQFSAGKSPQIDGYRQIDSARLPSVPISSCDHSTINRFTKIKSAQKEYPTKPIITRNSISHVYKHPHHSKAISNVNASNNSDSNNNNNNNNKNKLYLILLSDFAASIDALDYYHSNHFKAGDTLIIASSLSSRAVGTDNNAKLQTFIKKFEDFIIEYIGNVNLRIVFEFFKSPNFLNDLLTLYAPSMVIIGTDKKYTRSTSFSTSARKFIPLIYAGLEELPDSKEKLMSNKDESKHQDQASDSSTTIVFREPFKNTTNNQTLPVIQIQEPKDVCFPHDVNQMFHNLSPSTDPKPKADRRGSTYSTSSSLGRYTSTSSFSYGSAIETDSDEDDDNIDNNETKFEIANQNGAIDTDENNNNDIKLSKNKNTLMAPQIKNYRSAGSIGSTNSMLSKQDKERLQLFEKYERRLSNVKVGDDVPRSLKNKKKSIDKDKNIKEGKAKEKEKESGFFKKVFGKW
ncbi:hypothetical protein DAMA08_006380 [Martiniozyma asiatica (nom. inval.)]|nr:hypothetical protein DAMA08_006380 [Martiniozyma asiatica]